MCAMMKWNRQCNETQMRVLRYELDCAHFHSTLMSVSSLSHFVCELSPSHKLCYIYTHFQFDCNNFSTNDQIMKRVKLIKT